MIKFIEGLNWVAILGIAIAIETQISNGTMSIAHSFPVEWQPIIKEWAGNLAGIGGLMVTMGSFGQRPAGQFTITPTAVKVLIGAFVLSFLLAGTPAVAQTKPLPHLQITGNPIADTKANFGLTGNASADIQALWQKIVGSSLNDLNYAAAMAKNAGTLQATTRLQCINAIIALNKQASGIDLKDEAGNPLVKPDPHAFTDVETLAEVVDNLAPTGPLFVSCAGAAQLAKTNVLAFVNAVVTGAAGFAAMPIIPGL